MNLGESSKMKTEYKLFTTEKGIISHWSFKVLGPLFLAIVWRLAIHPFMGMLWFFLVATYGLDDNAEINNLMLLSWWMSLLLAYFSMWVGSFLWKRREQKLKQANPPATPMLSWYLNFAFGLTVFVFLQMMLVGMRVLMVLGKP